MKVISEEVAVLASFDLWIFLRGIPFFLKGERKNGLFLVRREKCVDTFGLFLLGGKSQPTSSMGGGGGLLLNGMAQTLGLIKLTENQNNKHFFGSVSLLDVTSTSIHRMQIWRTSRPAWV